MVILECKFCNTKHTIYSKKPIFNCQNHNNLNINISHKLDKNLFNSNIASVKIKNIFQSGYYVNNIVDTNPYIIYKAFFFSYYLSQYLKIDFNKIIYDIDKNLKIINNNSFIKTKIISCNLNHINPNTKNNIKIFIKNETNNISGSHKSRHLMGNIIYFDILYKKNIYLIKPKLGIYSCGNAAIAAAIIAKSAQYQLNVYIPTNVSQNTIKYLKSFDANIVLCPRSKNIQFGDPCYHTFKQAIKQQEIIPFSCSGIDNWSNIEGGQTLCLEYVFQLIKQNKMFDSVIIQVGGGALASSFIKTLNELYKLHIIKKMPTIYITQTQGCFPIIRAYYLIIKEIARQNNLICSLNFKKTSTVNQNNAKQNNKIIEYISMYNNEIIHIANFIKKHYYNNIIQNILNKIIQYNTVNDYMWSWEIEPISIAQGILDDITYDWIEIIHGLLSTGGIPIIITENDILNTNIIAKKNTNINVSYTGSSGLAGLIKLDKLNLISQDIKNIATIFTGIERE